MNNKLQRQFDQLEKSKTLLLEKLERINPKQLTQKPNERSWSIMQVVSHLIKIELGSVGYMKKKLSYNPVLRKTGLLTALKMWLTNVMMKLPIKYKTADFLEEAANNVTFAEAKNQWAEAREQMRDFYEGLSHEQLTAALHKNLAAGRVNVYQQMSFIQVHFDRHVWQIERIINKL